MKNITIFSLLLLSLTIGYSQTADTTSVPDKVHHVEPLFIDLVRDLGARKGEKELNIGSDFINTNDFREYAVLAEYEFAPIDRLGLEIETDFTFFDGTNPQSGAPKNKLDKLMLSAQYSFLVSTKHRATLALGYAHEFKLTDFASYGKDQLVEGMVYKPFFVAAKRLGENFHALVLTGPMISSDFIVDRTEVDWQINTSFHYGIPNSENVIGVEFNKAVVNGLFEMTMRPQVKLQMDEALAIGVVAGFPIDDKEGRFSSFFRIIYEL